jgi:hypothetical protein
MARSEDGGLTPPHAAPRDPRPTEGALGAFFDAARAAPVIPPVTLTAAILADAEALLPRSAAPQRPPSPPPQQHGLWRRIGALARPIGGWGGMAALAGCLALGFWVGASGPGADIAAAALWTEAAAADAAVDSVDGFFDLASGEG